MYYSAGVVGITTTAFLDAAVVGRPVMSFYADDLVPEHEASLHFQYLVDYRARTADDGQFSGGARRQLTAVLAGPPRTC